MKRMMAILLAAALLLAGVPAALAAQTVSAGTPVESGNSARLNNIRLAAQAIDGTRVPAWGSFSFNDTVGPRTGRRGYVTAPNGRGVQVTGGGVAQVASTLYLALLKLGDAVSLDPVKTYGSRFVDSYVQNPDHAVITDYDAGLDLSFENMEEALFIDMWVDDDTVWCVLTRGGDTGFGFADEEEDDPVYPEEEAAGEADDGSWFFLPALTPAPQTQRGLLGEAVLDCGGDGDVLHNVRLAADSVNDTLLEPGDTFSFNDVVGPRTGKYGYRKAINGRGVRVSGGGVAQVASALYMALKGSGDIEFLEKSTYGKKYNQRYVKDAADAIVTDYSSGRDFSFRYDGDDS
ncbi:MAG: VanW family protein, partial [Clostridia bacterium]|nr:VanW family protein [Clostridia bacterium]